jgi:hypothetical protein
MPVEIIGVAKQREIVKNTTSLNSYGAFVSKHFIGNKWMEHVTRDLSGRPEEELPPDLFRFFGLVGIVTAQYGFDSLYGQVERHRDKGWKKPPTHPAHQLGVLVYMAKLNEKSYWKKNILTKDDPSLTPGIWGISLGAKAGGTTADVSNPYQVRQWVKSRMNLPQPICLPDRPLNGELAELSFSGRDAERMPQKEFERDILPELRRITEGILDPIPVFQAH